MEKLGNICLLQISQVVPPPLDEEQETAVSALVHTKLVWSYVGDPPVPYGQKLQGPLPLGPLLLVSVAS